MIFDYERSIWLFENVTMAYMVDGKTVTDKVTGNIKWTPSPQRATNGEGQYEFDIRVNEPDPASKDTEATAFEPSQSEADFFAIDASRPCLTGTAKYKDMMRGETPIASDVTIELTGNSLTRAQVMNLSKLILFVEIVPMNAE